MSEKGVDYEDVLADLEAKRDHLESVIAGIKALLAQGVVLSAVSTSRAEAPAEIESHAFFSMSIPDAAKKFLEGARKPQATPAIADALRRGGMTTTSKDFTNTVGAALRRQADDGDIVKVGNDWGLREWFPGLKRRPKANGKPGTEESQAEAREGQE
jgi:hypothetical protein